MNLTLFSNKLGTVSISCLTIKKLILSYFNELKININRKNIKIDTFVTHWNISILLKVKPSDNLQEIHEHLQKYILDNIEESISTIPDNIHLIFSTATK